MDTMNLDLQHLLHGESETVEWKRSLSEAKEIVVSAAAFASLQGGQIGIGIEPTGAVCAKQTGVSAETAKRDLTKLVADGVLARHYAGRSTVYRLIGSFSGPIDEST